MSDLAIVIPAYKPDFLDATLRSFQNQSDKRFHIYIADDCSPFDLRGIVEKYEKVLPLTYHRFESNLGQQTLVGHWSRAIELAQREEWIWLFSDDDVADADCVKSFHAARSRYPQGELFHFNIYVIDSKGEDRIETRPEFPLTMSAGEFLEAKLRGKVVSYVVEFIFSRSLYNRVGGFTEFDLAWGSDFITWLKMAADTPPGIVTIDSPDAKVGWRQSALNISPDKSYRTVKRKLRAMIENAAVIKSELKNRPEKYQPLKYSFRWIRFPIGEIWRNRRFIKTSDMVTLCKEYFKKVIF